MKKLVALFLACMLTLSLAACKGGTEPAKTDGPSGDLQVGYSKVNITPEYAISLGGYGDYDNRVSDSIRDDIYLTCIAASYQEQTVLIYTMDLLNATYDFGKQARKLITSATQVPEENIFFGATHNHSGPIFTTQYTQDVLTAATKAAKQAMADRTPAEMLTAKGETKNMAFVRHYKLEDGTYKGSNFNEDSISPIVEHAAPADEEMIVIKFDRAGDKKDVVLVNFQFHMDHAAENGYKSISADSAGALRNYMENKTGMEVAYFTGASGNLSHRSLIPELTPNLTMTAYGEALADKAISLLDALTPVSGTGIKTVTKLETLNIDHSWDHMIVEARKIQSINQKQGRDIATAAGKEYGFSSAYHANSIVTKASMPATEQMWLGAFSICGIGFVNATYEMFCDTGMYIKENAPFDTTFIITGNNKYLATEQSYEYHSYEADTGYYEKGTAEKLGVSFVELLNTVK